MKVALRGKARSAPENGSVRFNSKQKRGQVHLRSFELALRGRCAGLTPKTKTRSGSPTTVELSRGDDWLDRVCFGKMPRLLKSGVRYTYNRLN